MRLLQVAFILVCVVANAAVMPLPRDGDRFAWQRVEWQPPLQASPMAPDSLLLWDYSHAAELDRDREV
ncbi:MAG: hypothetical protein IJU62_09540, partial [Muribaculaceae bacterium]|nr:hypothetical protein [Muribaculaceae bacterium]